MDEIDRLWDENRELLKEKLFPRTVQIPIFFSGDTQMTFDTIIPIKSVLKYLKINKGKEGTIVIRKDGGR